MLVKLLRSFFNYYFLSSLSGALISFGIVVYYSHVATTAEYIQLGVFSSMLGMMPAVMGFHARSYFIREASRGSTFSKGDVGVLIATLVWMLVSLLLFILLAIGAEKYFGYELEMFVWVVWVGAAQWFHLSVMGVAHSKKDAKRYFLVSVIAAFVSAVTLLVFGVFSELTWKVRAYSLVVGFAVSCLLFFWWYASTLKANWKGVVGLRDALSYSIPLVPYSLSIAAVMFVERYVVANNFDEMVAAGYLSLVQLVLVFSIFLDSIYKKVTPVYLSAGKSGVLTGTLWIVVPAFFGFIFMAPFVFEVIFPEAMLLDWNLLLFMAVAAVIVFLVKLISLIYNYHGDNSYLSFVMIFYNGLALVGLYFFVPDSSVLLVPVVVGVCNLLAVFVLFCRIKVFFS